MKFASIFLSLVLLILSCLPCADAAPEAVADKGITLTQNHSDHSKELHTDLCSPFCVCNCCGAQILSFTPQLVININREPVVYATKLEITYKSNLASMFSGSIWQPPQLS